MSKLFLSFGAVSGAIAVLLGAFGAHGLKGKLTEDMLTVYRTAVEYHFWHTLALMAVGLLAMHYRSALLSASGWAFLAGIVLFSGSLYLLAVSGIRILGAITPVGGLCFITGWVLLAISVIRSG